MIVSGNGTEFTSIAMLRWSGEAGMAWHFIAPGKPMQNVFIESFNGTLRKVQMIIEAWPIDQKIMRPHGGLGSLPPATRHVGGASPGLQRKRSFGKRFRHGWRQDA